MCCPRKTRQFHNSMRTLTCTAHFPHAAAGSKFLLVLHDSKVIHLHGTVLLAYTCFLVWVKDIHLSTLILTLRTLTRME